MIRRSFINDSSTVFILAALSSICISLFVSLRPHIINPDGICYLSSAEMFSQASVKQAMSLCGQANWPFYAALIFSFVQLFQVSYEHAAQVINTLLTLLSVTFFLAILKQLGAHKRVLGLGAMVILLAHDFNSTREYIIRDHGFWAFYLASFFCSLRYFACPNVWLALFWGLSLIVATLFRIEGAIYLLLLPFLVLIRSDLIKNRIKHFVELNLVLLLSIAVLTVWWLQHAQHSMQELGRIPEVFHQVQQGLHLIVSRFNTARNALGMYVLTPDSAKHATSVMSLLLIVWYGISVVTSLSIGYAIACLYGLQQRIFRWPAHARLVFWGYCILNVGITFVFLLERFFLSKRYLISLSLLLMLLVPFSLSHLWDNRRNVQSRLVLWVISIFVAISALGGLLEFGTSKQYIAHAGHWIAENIPKKAKVYINDYQIMYYSKHFPDDLFKQLRAYEKLTPEMIAALKFDYIVLRDGKRNDQLKLVITQKPIKVFRNPKGDEIMIYQLTDRQWKGEDH